MQTTCDDYGFAAALKRFNTRVQEEKETLIANTDRLMSEPLLSKKDAARLAELEKRFGGGEFFLNTASAIIGVKSVGGIVLRVLGSSSHYSAFADIPGAVYASGRPKLVVEYKGQYIDLAHLWV